MIGNIWRPRCSLSYVEFCDDMDTLLLKRSGSDAYEYYSETDNFKAAIVVFCKIKLFRIDKIVKSESLDYK